MDIANGIIFNYESLRSKLITNLINNLGYNNQAAEDQAKRIADIFNVAYSSQSHGNDEVIICLK